MCLRASAGGAKAFYQVYSKADGRRAWLRLGAFPDLTLAKARERARETRGAVGEGHDPVAEKKARDASQTVSDLVENYVSRHASTKRSGDEIARRLRKNVSDVIGDIKVADLHRRDVTRCIDKVKDRGADVEANRIFEDLRAMIRWARSRGDIDENIAEGMKKPTAVAPRDRILSADEIRTMWQALKTADVWDSTKRIVRLCLVVGQRVGEVSGMTVDELDLDRATWTIPAQRSKNGREHVVPLSGLAVQIISEQIGANEALAARKGRSIPEAIFPGPGGRGNIQNHSIAKAIKRREVDGLILGIRPWTCHDLRRTMATHLQELGVSPLIVGNLLNHVTISRSSVTLATYAIYSYEKEKREALEIWADRLEAIVSGVDTVVSLSEARHG